MLNSSGQNPFPGIRSFESTEDYLFFGREKQVADIARILLNTHFLAIIGSSGCGKSSLVKAGLIPALFKHKYDKPDIDWSLILFRPGDDPIGNLSTALLNFYDEQGFQSKGRMQHSEIETILREKDSGLHDIVREQAKIANKKRLIIIDQFEEIFRFKKSEVSDYSHIDASQFINLALKTLEYPESNVYIIITMRSDFLSDCTEYEGLPEAINVGDYLVPRMTVKQKEDAIRKPIELFDRKVTDRLVERLLLDVGDDPDQLPVMQHALMRTWDYWRLNKLKPEAIDIEHYEAIGTMSGALSMHAEEIYNELPGLVNKGLTEKLFKALTDLGADNHGIRRPTSLVEICKLTESTEDNIVNIIDVFRARGRAFLMPPAEVSLNSDSVIDISHESIMRVWSRLREWVDDETKSAQLYMRLSKAAELYHEGKTGLWVDPDLALALQWKQQNKPNATWAMRYDSAFDRAINFMEYSDKQFRLEISIKEKKHKRDLKRARRFAVILGSASLICLLFLIVSLKLMSEAEASEIEALKKEKAANIQKKEAVKQKKEAVVQKKISEQQQHIAEQQKIITEEQKQIAIKQQGIAEYRKQEAINQKLKADEAKEVAIIARNDAEEQKIIAVEQRIIADDNRVIAETAQEKAERLRMLAIANSMAIKASELSRTKEPKLAALLAKQAYIFNKENGGLENEPDIFNALLDVTNESQVMREHKNAVRKTVFTNSDNTLISCSDDGTVVLTKTEDNSKRIVFNTGSYGQNGFRSLAINQVGKIIAAGNLSGEIIICNVSKPDADPQNVLKQHTSIISALDFHNGTNKLISAGVDGKIILWNLDEESENFKVIQENNGPVSSICFNHDGTMAVCGKNNGSALIIDLQNPDNSPIEIKVDSKKVTSVAYSNDGTTLALGLNNGLILLYNTENLNSMPVKLVGHISGVTSLSFSEVGNYLASGSYDKTVRIWMHEKPDIQPVIIRGHDSWVYGIDYSSDGNKIASCSADKTVQVFTINPNILADEICKNVNENISKEDWNKYIGEDIQYRPVCK
ncbi:MAG: hypothetical protein GY834_02175 [Bacteroidetes bacterium]|nr:hypothetical protein [Bacteroidota bacterium]